MNEITKTSIFIAIALVLLLFAWLVQPRERSHETNDLIGRELLENFKDPSQIKELRIVKYIPDTGDLVDFRVAEVDGKWCLPSHQNYPADADTQMGLVASDFVDRKVLDVAYKDTGSPNVREMHATYGVIDPNSKNPGAGDGVGVKVIFTGPNRRVLAALIIGKEVENTNGMHSYVRVPEQNTVYVMAINKDHLSTKFDDWIEKNLLDISSYDLDSVRMQDYSTDLVETEQGAAMVPLFHSYYKVDYDPMTLGEKWRLDILQRQDPKTGQRVNVTLAPEETVNEKKLEDMRQAFDDLKIIDVLRKPETIASAQREGKPPFKTEEDVNVLQDVGFILHASQTEDGKAFYRFYTRQGEAFIDMKDGIVYHLLFGNLTGTNIAENANAPAPGESGEQAAGASATAATNVLSANRYLMILAEFDASIVEKPAPIPLTEVPAEGDEQELAKLKQQRESDERHNKQLEDEYNAAIEAGKRRAAELNLRFADWFYVISDEVFKKIHLIDSELVITPGQPAPDSGRDAALDGVIQNFVDGANVPAGEGEEVDFSKFNIDQPPQETPAAPEEKNAEAKPTEETPAEQEGRAVTP